MSSLSKTGVQFCPPSIVFQTPPATPPKYQVFGSPGTPSIVSARPPRNGPICRHCIPLNNFSSTAPTGVGEEDGLAANEIEKAKTKPAKMARAAKRKRNVDVIIRLKWESCVTVQLESRAICTTPGLAIFTAIASGQRGYRLRPRHAQSISNSHVPPFHR